MEIIIFILIVIIFILSFYLFLLRKEIRRTAKELKIIGKDKSNVLLNKEFDDKNFNELIVEINTILGLRDRAETEIYSKNKALKKVITNVAHDLRTPLTSAIGYMDIIKTGNLQEAEKEKYMSIIEERLNKLSYLITNFFDFSKIISSDEDVELEKENIIQILE